MISIVWSMGILFNIVGKHTDSNTGSVGENIYTSQVRWHTYDNTYATSQGEYIFWGAGPNIESKVGKIKPITMILKSMSFFTWEGGWVYIFSPKPLVKYFHNHPSAVGLGVSMKILYLGFGWEYIYSPSLSGKECYIHSCQYLFV